MNIDYSALFLDPIYEVFGVDAVLTLNDTAGTEISLTAIDKTSGVMVGQNVQTGTTEPGAVIRYSELTDAGCDLEDLLDTTISFSGLVFRVIAHHPKPVPTGKTSGEIILILEES